MNDRLPIMLLLAAAAIAVMYRPTPAPEPTPAPSPPRPLQPDCPDGRCPAPPKRPSPRPWEEASPVPVGAYVTPEPALKSGEALHVLVPREWHVKNRGGSDGSGLCVYASCRHTGLVQSDPVFTGMFEWMFKRPGGSYPAKLAKSIADYAKEKGLVAPKVLQVERMSDFSILQKACASGRLPGVTYSRSPTGRYGGARISHMVSLPHCDSATVAVLDNNYPGSYEVMSLDEARKVGVLDWAVFLLSPGAPPPPIN